MTYFGKLKTRVFDETALFPGSITAGLLCISAPLCQKINADLDEGALNGFLSCHLHQRIHLSWCNDA